jgi:hypothetical protein
MPHAPMQRSRADGVPSPLGASKTVLVVRQAWARFLPARTYPHAPRDNITRWVKRTECVSEEI